jgi:hypothetical protein
MSNISFNWEVTRVDEQFRSMSIKYTREGYQEYLIGTPLPSDDFPLEEVVKTYAPIGYWREEDRNVVVPYVGKKGSAEIDNDQSTVQVIETIEPNPFVEQNLNEDEETPNN